MKKITGVFLLGLMTTYGMSQSPWVKGKGNGYAQVSFNMITEYGSLYSNSENAIVLPRLVTDKAIQFYGEYGIGGDWQVSAALPYKLMEVGDANPEFTGLSVISDGTFNALGNIELAIKKNFINNDFLLSGQLKTELPTSSLDDATGLRSGLDALSIVPSVTIGKGWSEMYGFVSLASSIRSNDFSGDVRISGELGVQPINKFWVVLVLDVVSSFENGTPEVNANQQQAGLYLNNQEYFAYGLKFSYEVKNGWGLNLAGYGGTSGNLVAKAPSINFGVYYQW